MLSFGKRAAPKPRQAAHVRLLPVAMATAAALLSVKAVAMAQDVAGASHEAPAAAPDASHAPAASAEGQAQAATAPAPAACTPGIAELAGLSQSEVEVLQALTARREALDARSSQMDTEGQLMTAAEQRLDQRLTELRRLETTVGQLLGQLDSAQEQRLATLVDVYQRMRAKDAATVFNGLSDQTLVQVAMRMRPQLLAEVMGRMEPARARALTQMLADQSRPPADGAALLQRAQNATPAPAATAPAPAATTPAAPAGR